MARTAKELKASLPKPIVEGNEGSEERLQIRYYVESHLDWIVADFGGNGPDFFEHLDEPDETQYGVDTSDASRSARMFMADEWLEEDSGEFYKDGRLTLHNNAISDTVTELANRLVMMKTTMTLHHIAQSLRDALAAFEVTEVGTVKIFDLDPIFDTDTVGGITAHELGSLTRYANDVFVLYIQEWDFYMLFKV